MARVLGVDAGELEPAVDPPAPVGDLKAELAAFTTVDACVTQRAAGDPLVGDALEAIGYDTLVRDACRLLDAAKARDAKRCADIMASALQRRCEINVAELAGDPEGCPFDIPGYPDRGRDAVCVALAARDGSLCAAALDRTARATCSALAGHDAAPCKQLPLRSDQLRCARDEERWAGVLPAAEAPAKAAPAASGKVSLTGDAGAGAGGEFALDVSRGVVVLDRLEGAHVMLGSMDRVGTGFIVASPTAPKTFAAEVVVPADPKKAHVDTAQLDVPGRPPLTIDGSRAAALVVRVTTLDKRRGGAVVLSIDGRLDEASELHATATTYVRDVVSSAAALGLPHGAAAGRLR